MGVVAGCVVTEMLVERPPQVSGGGVVGGPNGALCALNSLW